MATDHAIGVEAIAKKGWWKAHQWLILRRISQVGILGLFLVGPVWDLWIVKGNLASSLTLGILPLTDPYVLLQTVVAGAKPLSTALIGAAIVVLFYIMVGGRSYCSWVCPVNIVTDLASWLRRKLGIKGAGTAVDKRTRYYLLVVTFIMAFVTHSVVWELVNPVSILHRGILFTMGMGWSVILFIFFFDLLVSNRAWCGRLCPVGAFYSVIGTVSQVRITADNRQACNDCMDCFQICPEPQVIRPALKGRGSPVISAANCTNCARCIDVCSEDVFHISTRYADKIIKNSSPEAQ